MRQVYNVPQPLDNTSFHYKDYPIGGKLVVGEARFGDEILQLNADEREVIRERLVKSLVEDIMAKKLCEFTQIKDPVTMDTIVRVRAYLAPDSDIKLLRTILKG